MFTSPTCERIFQMHCQHWQMTDEDHALAHAIGRLINDVGDADAAAGIDLASADSTSSVDHDGPRLRQYLADEGWQVVRATAP